MIIKPEKVTIKIKKIRTPQNIAVIILRLGTVLFYYTVMGQKHAVGIANSVDTDQTAPLGAVWSGSALFAKTCLSENLGSLR